MVRIAGPRMPRRTIIRRGGALLLLIAAASLPPLARADLYSAAAEYKKGDYAQALADFLALAELGQPQAQLDVALMYRNRQGAEPSDIHAYAWAVLAAQNGEIRAKKLADEVRPQLAPGSERIAGWITAHYCCGGPEVARAVPSLGMPTMAIRIPTFVRHADHVYDDPVGFEIRAAAEAAEGDFAHAVKTEQKAIRRAQPLKWDLSPLHAYLAGKPWYGNLLDF